MLKRKVIWYSTELANCPYYSSIRANEHEFITVNTEKDFLSGLQYKEVDAAIICFCSPCIKDVDKLLDLNAKAGPVPIIVCSKFLNCEFVRQAALFRIERFLECEKDIENFDEILIEVISRSRLKNYVKLHWPGCFDCSPHIDQLIDEIIRAFPKRNSVDGYARRIGINRCWLHKICKQAFNLPCTSLLRNIWVHQALCMMENTQLSNLDIAYHLNYCEESSMARDFRKELGFSPSEARKRLGEKNPEELLH